MLIEALVKRYEAQIAEAEATLEIYLDHSVGIGEHPHSTLMKWINYLKK